MVARKIRKIILITATLIAAGALAGAQEAPPAPGSVARPVGTVKAVSGGTITLATDAGAQLLLSVPDSARIVRIEPGQKDLSGAVPLVLTDIQVGDRMLVRGKIADDGKSIIAASVILMKHADVAEKQKRELEAWQRHGTGGLVKGVDPATGTITLITTAATSNTMLVRVAKDTVILRYAPDSVHFDDAKRGTLEEIKPGDQLRARGTRNPEGTEFAAAEIVSGTFRNIAGTIQSVDATAKTVTVMDLASKKPVVVKITADTQMRKLMPMVAQFIALRLRGGGPGGAGSENGGAGRFPGRPAAAEGGRPAMGAAPGEHRANGENGSARPGDIQQMLSRMPAVTLAEMQKGEALMIVTTLGAGDAPVTALTLLSGVEPILTAPNAASVLSPWNLNASGGESPE